MKLFLNSHNLEQKHLDRFRELIGADRVKKALFITTAAVPYGLEPPPAWLTESLDVMRQFAEVIDETTLEEGELFPENLSEYGFVFVSGGNSFYLAYRFAQTGFDKKLINYIQNGCVYSGSSTGSVILMDSIENFAPADEPEKAPEVCPGLGIIDEAIIVHVDNKKHGEVMVGVAKEHEKAGYEVVLLNDNQVFVVDGEERGVL